MSDTEKNTLLQDDIPTEVYFLYPIIQMLLVPNFGFLVHIACILRHELFLAIVPLIYAILRIILVT